MKNISQYIMIIVAVFYGHILYAANECQLKYKSNGSSFQLKNINKGQSLNFIRSNFTDAFNTGRNDMRLTLEYFDILSQRTKIEYLYLIKIGSNTLPLPPIVLIDKKLKRIQCKNYATKIDVQNYLQQFGQSATTLVNQVKAQATTVITSAANAAVNSFTLQTGNAMKSTSEAVIQQVTNALEQARTDADNAASSIQLNLAQHFPEVQSAVIASSGYQWRLGNSVILQGEQNIQNTLGELTRLDNKYQVSQTASNLVNVNLATDFPEFNNLISSQCKFKTNEFDRFTKSFNSLNKSLTKLDKKYQFSKTASKLSYALLKLPKADVSKVSRFMKFKSCKDDWSKIGKTLTQDWNKAKAYTNRLSSEIKKLDTRLFTGKQKRFFDEAQKLIRATQALEREHKSQEIKEDRMFVAKKAHQVALEKIDKDIGPMGDFLEKLPGGEFLIEPVVSIKNKLPKWMTRDPERLKANLADAKRKGVAYENAALQYDASFDSVQKKYDAWLNQISVTHKAAIKFNVKLPNALPLIKMLKSSPKINITNKAIQLAMSCAVDSIKITNAAVDVFSNAIGQYILNINNVVKMIMPKDLRMALSKLYMSVNSLAKSDLSKIQISVPKRSYSTLTNNFSTLKKLLNTDPTTANFSNQVVQTLGSIERQLVAARKDIVSIKNDLSTFERKALVISASLESFTKVLNKHGSGNWNDLKIIISSTSKLGKSAWTSLIATTQSNVDCLDSISSKIQTATRTFTTRLKSFIHSRVSMLAQGLPQSIKNQLSGAKNDISTLLSLYRQFKTSVQTAKNSYTTFTQSRNQAISSLIPIPKSNAVQLTQQAVTRFNTFNSNLNTVAVKFQNYASKQVQFVNRLVSLKQALERQEQAIKNDARNLIFTAFNTSIVSQQSSEAQTVLNKWNTAVQTLPSRIASLATAGISERLELQIEQGINAMNSKLTLLTNCLSTATSRRSSITSSQRRVDIVNQTISGLHADVTSTINSLKILLPPTINILNNISTAMTKAVNLSNKLQVIETTARNNFTSNASNLIRQFNTAKQCVSSNKTQILTKKNQLLQLLN